jgi:hypothetical protein
VFLPGKPFQPSVMFASKSSRLLHNTYYGRNLPISILSENACPWQAFKVYSLVKCLQIRLDGANSRVEHLKGGSLG